MGPLKGFKIIEMAGIGPGPFCGMILADLGAEIIRVDRASAAGTGSREEPANRGKKSIAVDLKSEVGVEVVLKLVERTAGISPIQRKRKIEDINIGETVYAIGNPQGLGQSVSMGIISAIGRKFINKEGSFIQTDASINPGNSGGALVDSNGNLLGVINFIESTTGGNQGLNFAIPIDVVSESYSKILKETKR